MMAAQALVVQIEDFGLRVNISGSVQQRVHHSTTATMTRHAKVEEINSSLNIQPHIFPIGPVFFIISRSTSTTIQTC